MIYGLNFGGPDIPKTPRSAFRKFKPTVKVQCDRCEGVGKENTDAIESATNALDWVNSIQSAPKCKECGGKGTLRYHLVGIGQSKAELKTMRILATNGTRKIYVEDVETAGGIWYGVYVF